MPKVKRVRDWSDALSLLTARHGPSTRVVVYPYAGIQHAPFRIDNPA